MYGLHVVCRQFLFWLSWLESRSGGNGPTPGRWSTNQFVWRAAIMMMLKTKTTAILLLPLPDPARPRKNCSTQCSWRSWQAADDHECWKILVLVGGGCFVILYNSIVLRKHQWSKIDVCWWPWVLEDSSSGGWWEEQSSFLVFIDNCWWVLDNGRSGECLEESLMINNWRLLMAMSAVIS